jgi:hypothetical protein
MEATLVVESRYNAAKMATAVVELAIDLTLTSKLNISKYFLQLHL